MKNRYLQLFDYLYIYKPYMGNGILAINTYMTMK